MKRILIAAAVALSTASGAQAADLAARPYTKAPPAVAAVYDWTGFTLAATSAMAGAETLIQAFPW